MESKETYPTSPQNQAIREDLDKGLCPGSGSSQSSPPPGLPSPWSPGLTTLVREARPGAAHHNRGQSAST